MAKILAPLMTGIKGEIIQGEKYLNSAQDGNPKVYVLNHQSTLDLVFLSYIVKKGVVLTAKKEVGMI